MIAIVAALLMTASAAPSPDEREEKVGDWTMISITDPITDEGRMVAVIRGEGGTLGIKCDAPGRDSVYIHWISDDYFGGDFQRRKMTVRFDQDAPFDDRWAYETDNAIQTWDREAMSFARRIVTAQRVVLRGLDFRGASQTGIWTLRPEDTRIALERVFETCRAGAL